MFLIRSSHFIKGDLFWLPFLRRGVVVVDDSRRDLLKVARACFGMTGDGLLVERPFFAPGTLVCFDIHFEM
jgi:hypothetical protein